MNEGKRMYRGPGHNDAPWKDLGAMVAGVLESRGSVFALAALDRQMLIEDERAPSCLREEGHGQKGG
jgi:hypothetical protein